MLDVFFGWPSPEFSEVLLRAPVIAGNKNGIPHPGFATFSCTEAHFSPRREPSSAIHLHFRALLDICTVVFLRYMYCVGKYASSVLFSSLAACTRDIFYPSTYFVLVCCVKRREDSSPSEDVHLCLETMGGGLESRVTRLTNDPPQARLPLYRGGGAGGLVTWAKSRRQRSLSCGDWTKTQAHTRKRPVLQHRTQQLHCLPGEGLTYCGQYLHSGGRWASMRLLGERNPGLIVTQHLEP